MGMTDDHYDPAFRYESLARETFNNCGKWGDPWGYAAQDVYSEFVNEPTTARGKRILSTILTKLVFDYKDTDIVEQLKGIEDSIAGLQKQEDVINIVDSTIALLRSLDVKDTE